MAIRVGFGFPQAEYNQFPEAWIAEYTRDGLMIEDPVMRWAYRNQGAIRWSALFETDRAGIMGRAARHGLRYGLSVSCRDTDGAYRSFGSFARKDREFHDDEAAALGELLGRLHESSRPTGRLTMAEREALGLVRDGRLLKEIAAELGISQNAVKQRLKNARLKLNARNGSHAVSIAVKTGLI
ncbi:helix-turn-helix transcriptional regulator [Roseicyclus sp.]|uniref:helix-turn-helix transcriptional regulator n=1 Tax=Roseicyclus sp. TaxID=1914329 RepID=UPI003F6A86F5